MLRYVLYVLAGMAVVTTTAADTVLLTNGHRMENVVARATSEGVTIRFSYGEMSLPASMVTRVEESESSLHRYLARHEALTADRDTPAVAWLELAFAARVDGLDDGYRRALLRAAALEPYLPQLSAPMRDLNYVLDEMRGRWLPFEESAVGLAQAAEREASRRVAAAHEAARAKNAQHDRLVETLQLALLAQAAAELRERDSQPLPQPGIPVWGPYTATAPYPAFGVVRGWPDTESNRATLRDLSRRQPGSLLPVSPRRPRRPRRPPARPRAAPATNSSSFKSPGGD